jgi:hypothetical protein
VSSVEYPVEIMGEKVLEVMSDNEGDSPDEETKQK